MSRKLDPAITKQRHEARILKWKKANPERVRAISRRFYARNRDAECERNRKRYKTERNTNRNSHYKRLYGITLDQYNALLEKQRGKCGICGATSGGKFGQFLAVDHCHDSKKIKGLLCLRCNARLGWYEKYRFEIGEYIGWPLQYYSIKNLHFPGMIIDPLHDK